MLAELWIVSISIEEFDQGCTEVRYLVLRRYYTLLVAYLVSGSQFEHDTKLSVAAWRLPMDDCSVFFHLARLWRGYFAEGRWWIGGSKQDLLCS